MYLRHQVADLCLWPSMQIRKRLVTSCIMDSCVIPSMTHFALLRWALVQSLCLLTANLSHRRYTQRMPLPLNRKYCCHMPRTASLHTRLRNLLPTRIATSSFAWLRIRMWTIMVPPKIHDYSRPLISSLTIDAQWTTVRERKGVSSA
jgi:hypothetical protein